MDVSFSFAVQSGCALSSGVFGWVSLKGILVLALPALPAPFPLSLSLSLHPSVCGHTEGATILSSSRGRKREREKGARGIGSLYISGEVGKHCMSR